MFNNNEVAYYRGEVVTVIRAYHMTMAQKNT